MLWQELQQQQRLCGKQIFVSEKLSRAGRQVYPLSVPHTNRPIFVGLFCRRAIFLQRLTAEAVWTADICEWWAESYVI